MNFRPFSFIVLLALCITACGTLEMGVEHTPDANATTTAQFNAQVAASATAIHLTALTTRVSATPTATPTPTATTPAVPPTATPSQPPSVTPKPSVASAPINTPQATAPATQLPVIQNFTADREQLSSGEKVTLAWTSNGTIVRITHGSSSGLMGPYGQGNLPGTGTLVINNLQDLQGRQSFSLWVYSSQADYDNGQNGVSQTVYVFFACKAAWFFAPATLDICPSGPADTQAFVEQTFEHGQMLWTNHGGSTGWIYILYDDGKAATPPDTWTSAEPESDPGIIPPTGYYQPVRGFGKAWRTWTDIRERLGWAIAPEHSFETEYQHGEALGDWKGWNDFVRLPGGKIVRIKGHYVVYSWEYYVP